MDFFPQCVYGPSQTHGYCPEIPSEEKGTKGHIMISFKTTSIDNFIWHYKIQFKKPQTAHSKPFPKASRVENASAEI